MKEDYLWDKTGEDAEIESLENALQAFRFQNGAPPALPQKVFTLEKEKPRRFFQLPGFGFAAFAAVLAVFSVVWFQTAADKVAVTETAPQNESRLAEQKLDAAPEFTPLVKSEDAPRRAAPEKVAVRRTAAKDTRPDKPLRRNKKAIEPTETLTAEERYAYNQLVLALSITGSQLKIVQDKINGIEEQNAVIEKAK